MLEKHEAKREKTAVQFEFSGFAHSVLAFQRAASFSAALA